MQRILSNGERGLLTQPAEAGGEEVMDSELSHGHQEGSTMEAREHCVPGRQEVQGAAGSDPCGVWRGKRLGAGGTGALVWDAA